MPPVKRCSRSDARYRRPHAERGFFGPAHRGQRGRGDASCWSACAATPRRPCRFQRLGGVVAARAGMPSSAPAAPAAIRSLVGHSGAAAAAGRSPLDRRHLRLIPRPRPTALPEIPQTPIGGTSWSKPPSWDRRRKKLWYSGAFSSFARLSDDIGHHRARMTTEFARIFRVHSPADCPLSDEISDGYTTSWVELRNSGLEAPPNPIFWTPQNPK